MKEHEAHRETNQEAYLRLRHTLGPDYAGQFVGIVDGEVVAHAFDFDNVVQQLDSVERDPAKRFVFRVGDSYPDKVFIL